MNINTDYTGINFKSYSFLYKIDESAAKKKILKSHNIKEAADTFEKFTDELKSKHLHELNKITKVIQHSAIFGMIGLTSVGLFLNNTALLLTSAALGFGSIFLTNKFLFPLIKKNNDNPYRDYFDIYSDTFAEPNENAIETAKHSPLKNYYKKHKKEDQENLYDWILNYYTETPKEDIAKFIDYIKNHYDEYYWNDLIVFCLRYSDGVNDKSRKANFANFLKLKEMSEAVYDMWHNSYIAILGGDIHRNNKLLKKEFDKYYMNKYPSKNFCDYLYNNWRKDENGIITDEEVENFKKFAKLGVHQAFEFLDICHNKDGHLAWNVADNFMLASVMIADTLYEEEYPEEKQKYLQYRILDTMVQKSYNESGEVDIKKFKTLHKQIKDEIDAAGIKKSKTLKAILGSELKTELKIFDDDITSINDAIIMPNRLFDIIDENELITKFLQRTECIPYEVFGLLYKLTTTENGKKKIIQEFSSNPRIGQSIKDLLIEKLGGDKKAEKHFNTWFFDEKNGYRSVYIDYYKHDLYKNAKDLMTLVKHSPNIGTWAFRQKAKELGVKQELGTIPEDFGTKNDFIEILKELKKLEKERDKKKEADKKLIDDEHEITAGNKKYFVSRINSGHSPKAKYIIKLDKQNTKKYVIKFSPYDIMGDTNRTRKFNDSFMLRGDSPYLIALVDFYLKENLCPNAPDIKYFDYNSKAILYEYTEGRQLELEDMDFYNAYSLNNSNEFKDVKDLGVLINDINYKNIIETKDGRLVIVDTGHAGFSSPFRPMVQGINISLSNLCGRELN